MCRLHGARESAETVEIALALCEGGSFTDTMIDCVEQGKLLPEADVRGYFQQLLPRFAV